MTFFKRMRDRVLVAVAVCAVFVLSGTGGCLYVNSSKSSDRGEELVGDFAPLKTGNTWVYQFRLEISGHGAFDEYKTIKKITLESTGYSDDTTLYVFSVEDSGSSSFSDVVADSCEFTISECNGVIDTALLCNYFCNKKVPFFIAHLLPAGKTVQTDQGEVYRTSCGTEWNCDRVITTVYRANTGLVYYASKYNCFGGSAMVEGEYMELMLVAFNGVPE